MFLLFSMRLTIFFISGWFVGIIRPHTVYKSMLQRDAKQENPRKKWLFSHTKNNLATSFSYRRTLLGASYYFLISGTRHILGCVLLLGFYGNSQCSHFLEGLGSTTTSLFYPEGQVTEWFVGLQLTC